MNYEGAVYRPPSEARSLIIQVTIGCSHNKCTFCYMYKNKQFRVRKIEDIKNDLDESRIQYREVKRIFLADGDALALKTDKLKEILEYIKLIFPECERVGIYTSPQNILRKSVDDLVLLSSLGLGIAYLGLESGSDTVLENVKKGVTSSDMIEAGKKVVKAGIKLSIMVISGLGGRELWKKHAVESARILNEIKPNYIGLLTLLVEPETEMFKQIQAGEFQLLKAKEVLLETKELLNRLTVDGCTFRSNHASNYLNLAGELNEDKERLLKQIDDALSWKFGTKDEMYRRL
ncbi:MAG: radical SAM protein [Clostridiales bacterium]|nr:radical SAM protein [Clostridiales bacterium]